MESRNLSRLPPFDKKSGALNIIVETPKDGRIKYKYNEKYGMFQFDKTMPYGFSFPFEFGFVPSKTGGDGDPLDVLVLSDEATFPGCLVLGQVLGVLQAEQREGKRVNRNDRLVAIPLSVKTQEPMIPIKTLDKALISDITKSSFLITKCKARNSNPWALAAVNVLWTWSKKHASERARKGSSPEDKLL